MKILKNLNVFYLRIKDDLKIKKDLHKMNINKNFF